MKTTTTFALPDLPIVIKQQILPLLSNYKIFTLTGPLGVGKTTLIKELLKQCGVDAVITSPTFSYVNSYSDSDMRTINHFDLYRIDSTEQFIASGFDELLIQKNSLNFIEWPEVIASFLNSSGLKHNVCSIRLEYDEIDEKKRFLSIIR